MDLSKEMGPGYSKENLGVLTAEFTGQSSIVKERTVSSAFKITRTGTFGKKELKNNYVVCTQNGEFKATLAPAQA